VAGSVGERSGGSATWHYAFGVGPGTEAALGELKVKSNDDVP